MAAIPLDQKIKPAVAAWREKNYERASLVTQRLLESWLKEKHRLKDWFKMVTGFGKPFVIAMAIVWHYFNRFFCTKNLIIVLLLMTALGCSLCTHRKVEGKAAKATVLEKHFIEPRVVELKITYHLNGTKRSDSDTVTLYEFSEQPVSWTAEKKVDRPVLLFYVARQREYPNQRDVEYISITPEPDEIVSKDIDGNVLEFWDLSDEIAEGKNITITRHFKFKAYETAFKIDPDAVGKYDTEDAVYRYYTRTQEFMELTPEVIKLAEEIVGNEENPYLKAKAIFGWCVDNISYKYPPNRGIIYCLPRGTGDCGSYSLIFVSLCRAVGIPARVANGYWVCKAKKNYHVWPEFYLPNHGWLPSDVTDGRATSGNPGSLAGGGDPWYFFGNMDSGRFISSKGTSIQLYPSPPWHIWGLADTNKNPIFMQMAATVYSGITIEEQKATVEIIQGEDVLW